MDWSGDSYGEEVRPFKIRSAEMTGLRVLCERVMRKWEVSRMTPKFLAEASEWVGVPLMKVGGQKEKQIWRKDPEFKFVYVNL